MLDQLRIGDKYSFDDFSASVAQRSIKAPAKKVIKETVPFSNQTYDFSKINGELYWEERELEYVFEITADTPAELEYKKTAFSCWVMNVMNEAIYDPHEPNFHFVGTYDDMEYSDDESVEKTTATVTFKAYPYKIANEETRTLAIAHTTGEVNVRVTCQSAHRITPKVSTERALTIIKDGVSYAVPDGISQDGIFKLEPGDNVLKILNRSDVKCNVWIIFNEEVF